MDECGEEVGGHDIDVEDVRAVQHSRVMDDGVHRPHPVDLFGDVPRLLQVGQVANNGAGAAVQEVLDCAKAGGAAYMHDDVVALVQQRPGSVPPQPVS